MHKGIMMNAGVRGAAGHSSNPELGRNAMKALHQAMGELLALRSHWQQSSIGQSEFDGHGAP